MSFIMSSGLMRRRISAEPKTNIVWNENLRAFVEVEQESAFGN